jgi:hypothetical protein
MDKRIVGVFRLLVVAILSFGFGLPILEPFQLECNVTEFIYEDNNPELRAMWPVQLTLFVYLLLASFYIFQTFMYLRLGRAMNGKDAGIVRFFKLTFKALRELPYDTTPTLGGYNNIERVLRYRDSKMANMGVEDAANYMRSTGHIDHMMTRTDLPQSQKALSYLNGRMGNMGNDDAIEFIKGNNE